MAMEQRSPFALAPTVKRAGSNSFRAAGSHTSVETIFHSPRNGFVLIRVPVAFRRDDAMSRLYAAGFSASTRTGRYGRIRGSAGVLGLKRRRGCEAPGQVPRTSRPPPRSRSLLDWIPLVGRQFRLPG